MGLAARALELNGIASVVVAWNGGRVRLVNPPRVLITRLERGVAFGAPGDAAQQRQIRKLFSWDSLPTLARC